jgi:hypothetical protein
MQSIRHLTNLTGHEENLSLAKNGEKLQCTPVSRGKTRYHVNLGGKTEEEVPFKDSTSANLLEGQREK